MHNLFTPKNSLQLLCNTSFIFLRLKWNIRYGSFHQISHFKGFFENIFNDSVSKPQLALCRCSRTHWFCWQEAFLPTDIKWAIMGDCSIVLSGWIPILVDAFNLYSKTSPICCFVCWMCRSSDLCNYKHFLFLMRIKNRFKSERLRDNKQSNWSISLNI